jgi:hypothetical protein
MASYAPNTLQGAFGQANAVPQQKSPPFQPYNDEPAFKPSDRRYAKVEYFWLNRTRRIAVILRCTQYDEGLTSVIWPLP